MESVLFGDAFADIEDNLCSRDLYILSLVCQTYHIIITRDRIERHIAKTTIDRISSIMGGDECVRMLEDYKCIIGGRFIKQVMLGEVWSDCNLEIYSPRSACERICKFMDIKNDSDEEKKITFFIGKFCVENFEIDSLRIFVYVTEDVNFYDKVIRFIEHRRSMDNYVLHIVDKKMHIQNMYDIFNRLSKLETSASARLWIYMYRRGFRFYSAHDPLKKILSAKEMLHEFYKVVYVKSFEGVKPNDKDHDIVVRNSRVYREDDDVAEFYITSNLAPDEIMYTSIELCLDPDCIASLLCNDDHYHCKFEHVHECNEYILVVKGHY